MALQATLSPSAASNVGRIKWIVGDPIGGGSLSGVITPTGHTGWVLANGSQLSNSGIYVNLYAAVGTKFGAAGTLPNLLDGIVPIPKGGSSFTTVGATGGEINHILSLAEFPSHTHTYKDSSSLGEHTNQANIDGFDPFNRYWLTRTSNSAGGGGSHNNMPPYLVIGYALVKL